MYTSKGLCWWTQYVHTARINLSRLYPPLDTHDEQTCCGKSLCPPGSQNTLPASTVTATSLKLRTGSGSLPTCERSSCRHSKWGKGSPVLHAAMLITATISTAPNVPSYKGIFFFIDCINLMKHLWHYRSEKHREVKHRVQTHQLSYGLNLGSLTPACML